LLIVAHPRAAKAGYPLIVSVCSHAFYQAYEDELAAYRHKDRPLRTCPYYR